jgi:hypothetical protein
MLRAMMAATLACVLAFPALAKTLRWNCVYTVVAKPEGVSKEEFKLEFVAGYARWVVRRDIHGETRDRRGADDDDRE